MSRFSKAAKRVISRVRLLFRRLNTFLSNDIWNVDLSDFGKAKAHLLRDVKVLLLTLDTFAERAIGFQSVALSYFCAMAFVPFIAVAFAITGGFGLGDKLKSMLLSLDVGKELIGQLLQQVLRTMRRRLGKIRTVGVGIINHLSEKFQLTPQVVALAPSDKILDAGLPLHPVGHIEHARLEIGNDIGTEREILEHEILRQSRKLSILLNQFPGQPQRLRTVYQSPCLQQIVNVRLQRLIKGSIVSAIYRNLRTAVSAPRDW